MAMDMPRNLLITGNWLLPDFYLSRIIIGILLIDKSG